MNVYPHIGVNVTAAVENVQRIQKTFAQTSREWPLNLFATKMPTGIRFLVASIEVVDDEHAIVAWEGRTYPYRQRFDQQEISREEDTDLRILSESQRDLSIGSNYNRALDSFGNGVLRNLIVNLRMVGDIDPADGSAVYNFVEELRNRPNIFFEAF